ncbi:MAG: 5-methylcytosine-specific restriction endonuclease system specificity protein McrC [Caldicoprobacteraceae bacterium]|jgi:5-methylcytosine-specific restriction enzyme subunit McrC
MIKDKSIIIKNIYYMLAYAFQALGQPQYDEIASEEFENIHDLFAAILAKGALKQLKQGLYREYINEHDNLPVLRGKLDLRGVINNKLQRKQLLWCEYDVLSANNIFNQIIKTTAFVLMKQTTVNEKHKSSLKKAMLFFSDVDWIDPKSIKWNMLSFHRNNKDYKILLNICYFVLGSLLLSTEKGEYKMATFLDDYNMALLFEKFVLEYYRYHYPGLRASSLQIAWDVDEGPAEFLPKMQTDIVLRYGPKALIIDTKFYTRAMQVQYGTYKFHSDNLYQIFAYVKNMDTENTGNIEGMLLYAKTEDTVAKDSDYILQGNKISVRTLDLNTSFNNISEQLNKIAESFIYKDG